LQLIFSDRPTNRPTGRPTDPQDFHDKFNDIIKNIVITNGLSYMSGWKRRLRFKCGFSVSFTNVFSNNADFYPYRVI